MTGPAPSPPKLPAPCNQAKGSARFMALAPMDGVTDAVFRDLITRIYQGQSGIDLCVTEFVRVTDQRIPDHVFLRHCPELAAGCQTPSGTPVMVQLLGGAPDPMAQAAKRAVALGARGIDINFGCPAKTVNRHDGGASLLRAPHRVREVTEAVRQIVPSHLPVSAKIRLGWDSDRDLLSLAQAAQDGGASWLTVHARTKAQMYRPPVNWRALAGARALLSIPVVANGDIVDCASDASCSAQSRCAALMIGRGVMADPGLFLRLRGHAPATWSLAALSEIWIRYHERLCQASTAKVSPLGRVKQWVRMAAAIRPELAPAFDTFKRLQCWEDAYAQLQQWICAAPGASAANLQLSSPPKGATIGNRDSAISNSALTANTHRRVCGASPSLRSPLGRGPRTDAP